MLASSRRRQRSQEDPPKSSEPPPHKRRGRAPERHQEADRAQNDLLVMLSKLTLRHEDTLQILLQQHQFILHLKTGPGSLIPLMMEKSQQWHAEKNRVTTLRSHLAMVMMMTLKERAEKMLQSTPKDENFKMWLKQNLVTEDMKYPYLSWNHQQKKLILSKDKALEGQELLDIMDQIILLMEDPQHVLRFHSMKKVQPDQDLQTGVAFPWMLTVTPQLQQLFQKLCYHSILLLVAVDLKRQTAARSQLAQQIASQVRKGRWESVSTLPNFTAGSMLFVWLLVGWDWQWMATLMLGWKAVGLLRPSLHLDLSQLRSTMGMQLLKNSCVNGLQLDTAGRGNKMLVTLCTFCFLSWPQLSFRVIGYPSG